MTSIETILADLKLPELLDLDSYAESKKIHRTMVWRYANGRIKSDDPNVPHNNSLLSQQEEHQIIQWIERFTDLGIPPIPQMIFCKALRLASRLPGKNWVSRFIARYPEIDSGYLKGHKIA